MYVMVPAFAVIKLEENVTVLRSHIGYNEIIPRNGEQHIFGHLDRNNERRINKYVEKINSLETALRQQAHDICQLRAEKAKPQSYL